MNLVLFSRILVEIDTKEEVFMYRVLKGGDCSGSDSKLVGVVMH